MLIAADVYLLYCCLDGANCSECVLLLYLGPSSFHRAGQEKLKSPTVTWARWHECTGIKETDCASASNATAITTPCRLRKANKPLARRRHRR